MCNVVVCYNRALLDDEKQWMTKQSDALSEKRAVQLIAEELLLDVSNFNN